MENEKIIIDPSEKKDYMDQVERKFANWHEREWPFQTYEEFRELTKFSFLAYIAHLLELVDDNNEIIVDDARDYVEDNAGEYFSERKFQNALTFLKEKEWEHLRGTSF